MQTLCALDELQPGAGREASVDGPDGLRHLVLFRAGGRICAYLNACPHQGRDLAFAPNEFLFDPDGRLICPHHGAIFDVVTGACLDGPCTGASLTPLGVLVRDGKVCLP